MQSAAKNVGRGRAQQLTEEQRSLINEYFTVLTQRNELRNFFSHAVEPELITSCIYEINALSARYTYLLGRIKEENISYLPPLIR